jgi:hypothetical protein
MGAAAMQAEHDRVTLVMTSGDTQAAGYGYGPGRGRTSGHERFEAVAREFPTVTIAADPVDGRSMLGGSSMHATPVVLAGRVEVAAWRAPSFDRWGFDRALDRAYWRAGDRAYLRAGHERPDPPASASRQPVAIVIEGPAEALPSTALEVLTRCQRRLDRRNRASRAAPWFDAVLRRHRAAHQRAPRTALVQADYDHALDVWQWLLRLDPRASVAVQLAALLHDIERLEAEAERRVEHHARDYQAFKDAHGRRGATQAAALLRAAGVPEPVVCRAARLIATHERQSHAGEQALLNDADALSFFAFNSAGFADYFGVEHTRRKVAYSLARLRGPARRYLDCIRLRPDIRALLHELLHELQPVAAHSTATRPPEPSTHD